MRNKDLIPIDILKQRALELGKPLADDDEQAGTPALIFEISDQLYAVHADSVAEVISDPVITPFPNLPGWVVGAINVRGDIIGVLNLNILMELSDSNPQMNYVLLFDNAQFKTGIAVHSIEDITFVANNKTNDTLPTIPPQLAKYLKGSFNHQEQVVSWLDAQQLINTLINSNQQLEQEAAAHAS